MHALSHSYAAETVTFSVSVLATKATKFFQLMAVSFSELTPGAPIGATYVALLSVAGPS